MKKYKLAQERQCIECTKLFRPYLDNVRKGKGECCSRSCGSKRGRSHGMSGTPLYRSWAHMKERCRNQNCKVYHLYGGRGISYNKQWETFINFYNDMAEGYAKGLELERIDNNKGYFKENCTWATRKEQTNNTRRNVQLIYQGQSFTYLQLAELLNVKLNTLYYRVNKGLLPVDIIKTKDIYK